MIFFKKIIEVFSRLFKNSAIMALIGVVIGGMITGFFNYKTQQSIISAQQKQFKYTYLLEKNNFLKKDIANFAESLSLILGDNKSKNEIDSLITSMLSISLKMMLTEDYNIGNKCWDLTTTIKKVHEKGTLNDDEFIKQITDWIIAIKTEMKTVDYTVDENAIDRDLMQFLLNHFKK